MTDSRQDAWDMDPLGSCLLEPLRYGLNAPAVPRKLGLPDYLRITDIDPWGRARDDTRVSVDHPKSCDYLLRPGDVVFARTGASVGKAYLHRRSANDVCFAGFLIRARTDPTLLLPEFLFHFTQSSAYWRWVRSMSARSGQPGVNAAEYSSMPIPRPDLGEQREIVAVLNDVDALAASLQTLVAKKQATRDATRHLLTTDQQASRGDSAWPMLLLRDLGDWRKGKGVRREDVTREGVPCFRYGDIYTQYGDHTDEPLARVPERVAEQALPLEHGDVLFAASGETKGEIGACVAYTGHGPAVAGGDIIVLRQQDHNPVFLGALLNNPVVTAQKARFAQGDAVVHIHAAALSLIEVALPSRKEQDAIAEILGDMDTEIAVLRARLAKAQQVKEGMLHELITGRTRLPGAEVAA